MGQIGQQIRAQPGTGDTHRAPGQVARSSRQLNLGRAISLANPRRIRFADLPAHAEHPARGTR